MKRLNLRKVRIISLTNVHQIYGGIDSTQSTGESVLPSAGIKSNQCGGEPDLGSNACK